MANINIGGRLHSTATGNVVAGANEILDDVKGKKQSVINQETEEALAGKQAALVSGTNIKTVNGESILGSGNIQAGDPDAIKYSTQTLTDAQKTQARTNIGAYNKPGTGIPATDLASAAQTSLGKADTAYQKPQSGVPKSDLASGVQSSLDLADTAVQAENVGPILPPPETDEFATKTQVTQLEAKVDNIEIVGQDPGEEESLEFQTDGGQFIAKVSTDGIEAKDVKAVIDGESVSITGLYEDESDINEETLVFGSKEGKNVVEFIRGHIKTLNFDSQKVVEDIEELKDGGNVGFKAVRKNGFLEDYYSYKYGKSGTWFERLRIMHFSDTHNNGVNLEEAFSLSNGLVHLVIDTGDNANANTGSSPITTMGELSNYKGILQGEDTPPVAICNGNHDVPELTKKQYFDIMCSAFSATNPGFVFGDSAHYRTYGYCDVTPNNTIGTVRVITLDPFDYDDGEYNNPYIFMSAVFSQTQINWLISTLRSAVSNGYKVITAMHYSWGDNPVFTESGSANPDAHYYQDPFMIPDIIDAMQKKVVLSKSFQDTAGINDITVNEDFSNIGDFHYICHLFGHIHSENEYRCQKTDGSKMYDILMVGAPNMGNEGYAINKVPLQPDTLNSIKLTVLEIDTVEKAIYRVNYGGFKAYDMTSTARTKKISYQF